MIYINAKELKNLQSPSTSCYKYQGMIVSFLLIRQLSSWIALKYFFFIGTCLFKTYYTRALSYIYQALISHNEVPIEINNLGIFYSLVSLEY